MFEAVRVGSGTPSTPARLAATAVRIGFDGIVLRTPTGSDPIETEAVGTALGIDVASGIEIRADDPATCSGYIGTYRSRTPILLVRGGSRSLNRFAAGQPRVDVLSTRRWEAGSIDHVLARTAKDNGVRLEVNLHPVLRCAGGERVRSIGSLRKLVDLVTAYDVPYVVTGDPASHLELRAPRELQAIGDVIGVESSWITNGLTEWRRLVVRNRERLDDASAAPGVKRGRHDR